MTGVEHQLTCELPDIPWPYFWEFEVERDCVYLNIKRRHWWWPLRWGQIERCRYAYFTHFGSLDQSTLNKVSEEGAQMAEQINPVKDVLRQARKVAFTTKVRVKKG